MTGSGGSAKPSGKPEVEPKADALMGGMGLNGSQSHPTTGMSAAEKRQQDARAASGQATRETNEK